MSSLAAALTAVVGDAFAAEGLARELGQVQASDRPDLAAFQCNGALAAAKAAKSNPRVIAEKIAARLKADPRFARVEIAGPGFLNLDVTDAALAGSSGDPVLDAHALTIVRGWRFAVPSDHPDGFSGELPMRFTTAGRQLAQVP